MSTPPLAGNPEVRRCQPFDTARADDEGAVHAEAAAEVNRAMLAFLDGA